ncbi:hypothetical protein [Deinococcus hohokamensis]|uniref:DUF2325 domain-containing protein n=1 Tax=Deinococcus hohokamensis TaxID=309883 RepID=A0ABV9IEZ3_9DEIO
MARLQTPDGRALPVPLSALRIRGEVQELPGGLTAHPQALAAFTETIEQHLDRAREQAENDEGLSVEEQGELIHSVLLGQVIVLGLGAYAATPDQELLEVISDLSASLGTISPLGAVVADRLPAISTAAGLGWLTGVPLLPQEYAHAALRVLEQAGPPISPAAQARLVWAGYRRPALFKDPLHPSRALLKPPATLVASRFVRDQELHRLAQSPVEGERNAALLLLHVNGRDRLENAPLVDVLDTAQVLLLRLLRAHREAGRDDGTAEALSALHAQLHRELGAPQLAQARRDRRQPDGDVETSSWQARRLLRALRWERLREPTSAERQQQAVLWDALNALETDLAAGLTPEQDDELKVRLLLLGLRGLVTTSRAPGMNLPPMVQLAVQVSSLDPLWAWESTQTRGALGMTLADGLDRLTGCLTLSALTNTPFGAAHGRKIRQLTVQTAGHVFAAVRRTGLRLPEQTFLETYFARLGSLRALPLNAAELQTVQQAYLEVLRAVSEVVPDRLEDVREEPLQVAAPEPDPDRAALAPPPVPLARAHDEEGPPHVLAVRERLTGQRVVLLGSVPSPEHRAALMRAFKLRELDWISSEAYAHGTHAHARVTPDTALVILAIRWMGHAQSALREVARAQGVPYVMHPGGLSPSSVAWQIMQQVSVQLDERRLGEARQTDTDRGS